MSRVQRQFFSAVLALMMALHVASELLEMSPTGSSGLSMLGMGVSALVSAAALGLFLRTRGTQADGRPFLSSEPQSRRRSIWLSVGGLILCLIPMLLILVVARLLGIGSVRFSQSLDFVAAVSYPILGSVALIGLLRSASAARAEKATSRA